ncbi:MAG: hypothetical protein RLY17_2188 [Pseudomonadota bacterium]|jgi:hypothetical protein
MRVQILLGCIGLFTLNASVAMFDRNNVYAVIPIIFD